MKRKLLFSALVILLFSTNTYAQKNIIDEVIWIVGDESILKSEVEEQKLRAQYEGTPLQGDPYCVIPEQIAINKLFLHQAVLDSIEVSESNVMNQVESRLSFFMSQIGSKEKMEEYFGKKTIELREDLRTSIREQMIIQQMQQKLVGDLKSTPADVRRYFNTLAADSVPNVPAQTELQIISFEPPVPLAESNRIKERLRDYTERVNKGTSDF
nr:peptidylprolyl isomerase [Paludibacter sp.]